MSKQEKDEPAAFTTKIRPSTKKLLKKRAIDDGMTLAEATDKAIRKGLGN